MDQIYGDETLRPIGTLALIPCGEHSRATGELLQHRYEVVANPDEPNSDVHMWICIDPEPTKTRLYEDDDDTGLEPTVNVPGFGPMRL